jgi:hypothetical protein
MRSTTTFTLDAGSNPYRHFMGPSAAGLGPTDDDFGYYNNASSVVVTVHGIVVWMFDRGVRFDNYVQVVGNTEATLILVAEKGHGDFTPVPGFPEAGIWFAGGLFSPQVRVILVTDGTLAIDHQVDVPNIPHDEEFNYLTLFGGAVYLKGPPGVALNPAPAHTARLRVCHHPGYGTSDADLDETVLDPLYENGLLPNVSGSRNGTLNLVQGTWREVTETSPN